MKHQRILNVDFCLWQLLNTMTKDRKPELPEDVYEFNNPTEFEITYPRMEVSPWQDKKAPRLSGDSDMERIRYRGRKHTDGTWKYIFEVPFHRKDNGQEYTALLSLSYETMKEYNMQINDFPSTWSWFQDDKEKALDRGRYFFAVFVNGAKYLIFFESGWSNVVK